MTLRAGRMLALVFCGWLILFWVAAWVLPPVDSRLPPQPLVFWSILAVAATLALATAVLTPIHFYQSWRRLSTVSNKAAYGVWLSFETLVVVTLAVWLVSLLLHGR